MNFCEGLMTHTHKKNHINTANMGPEIFFVLKLTESENVGKPLDYDSGNGSQKAKRVKLGHI